MVPHVVHHWRVEQHLEGASAQGKVVFDGCTFRQGFWGTFVTQVMLDTGGETRLISIYGSQADSYAKHIPVEAASVRSICW